MATNKFLRTTASEALRLMFAACEDDRPYTLFDVRDAHSYGHGHLPGALTLDEHTVGLWLEKLAPADPVFVYCQLGFSSQTFAKRFTDFGFREVHNIDGGFPALVEALRNARDAAYASASEPDRPGDAGTLARSAA